MFLKIDWGESIFTDPFKKGENETSLNRDQLG